jgi:predicted RNA-binding Zn-ribbon protein involved in translation (DUF1610 family)
MVAAGTGGVHRTGPALTCRHGNHARRRHRLQARRRHRHLSGVLRQTPPGRGCHGTVPTPAPPDGAGALVSRHVWPGWQAAAGPGRETAGIIVRLVDERGTSSTCPACGKRIPKPAGRVMSCPSCGLTGHRDLLAAANIAARTGGGTTPAAVTHRRAGAHLPGVSPARRDPGAAPIPAAPAGPLAGTGPPCAALPRPGGESLAPRRGARNATAITCRCTKLS